MAFSSESYRGFLIRVSSEPVDDKFRGVLEIDDEQGKPLAIVRGLEPKLFPDIPTAMFDAYAQAKKIIDVMVDGNPETLV